MAITPLITDENAVNRATIFQSVLLDAKLRLVQNYTPSSTDNRTVLEANECNFTGYTAGGYNLGTWYGPSLPPGGGSAISAGLVNVEPSANNTITNNVTALWIEANNALTGNVATTFLTALVSPAVSVTVPTDAFQIAVQDVEGLST